MNHFTNMVTKKFKYSDSIDDAVKLLDEILRKNQEVQESEGKGKKVKIYKGIKLPTRSPPKIPLELPLDYFSNLDLKQLKEKRTDWQSARNDSKERLDKAVEKLDKFISSSKGVKESIGIIENLNSLLNYWNTRTEQIDFLLRELNKAILVLEPAQPEVLVLGLSIKESVKLNTFQGELKLPPRYFSGLNLEQLEETRKQWSSKRESQLKKLLTLKSRQKERGKSNKKERGKIEKLEKEGKLMDILLGQLEKAIRAFSKMKKRRDPFKDPILEEIKTKMGIPPKRKEPPPPLIKKKAEFKFRPPPVTQTMFNEGQTHDIEKLFRESRNARGTEIEASFGVFKNGDRGDFFTSGVYSGIYFSNLLARLFAVVSSQKYGKMGIMYSNTKVEIKNRNFQQGGNHGKRFNVRKIIYSDGQEQWEYKYRPWNDTINNRIWGIRVSKSIETHLDKGGKTGDIHPSTLGDVGVNPEDWNPDITRYRKRTSFTEESEGFFYGVRIDLTVVRKVDHGKPNDRGTPIFEVEVEKINSVNITANEFTDIIEQLYRWMFGDYRYAVFIKEPISSGEKLISIPVNWDKNMKLFSDGIFAYMTEKGDKRGQVQKAYGKIVQKSIRLLSADETKALKERSITPKNIKKADSMERMRQSGIELLKKFSINDKFTWDADLKIITDGIYAYASDYKIYAIVVGPEELTESDKGELKQMGKNIKHVEQAEVNKITKKIQKRMKGAISAKELEELEELESDVDTEGLEVLKPRGYEEERTYPHHIMTLEERRTAVNLHNKLFWYDMQKKHIAPATGKDKEACANNYFNKGKLQPYQLWTNYWNRPKNIKLKNLLEEKNRWAITLKYDGTRSFLFIHEYGVYMVNPPYTLIYMGKGDKDMSGTLLDGEFISDLDKTTNLYTRITFWAFDILFYRGEDCRDKHLIERLSILDRSVKTLQENPKNFPYLKKKEYILKDSPVFEKYFEKDSPVFEELSQEKDTDLYENIRYLLRENKGLLGKIGTYLKEAKITEEMVTVLLRKIEDLLRRIQMPVKEIEEILVEADLTKKNVKKNVKWIVKSLEESKEIVEKTDGLIFQPYIRYCNPYTFKWKPPIQLTIDFYLQRMTEKDVTDLGKEFHGDQFYYYTKVGETGKDKKNDMKIFKGDYNHPYDGYIMLGRNTIKEEGGEPIDGRIVECEWRKYVGGDLDFVPLRIREDRTRPNDETPTAISNWEDINNPITQDTIEGLNLKIMRKYHNEIKMNLLSKSFAPGATILDIGSGRGGDIQKWKTLGLGKVYAMEPDIGDTIEEFNKRLEQDRNNKLREDMKKECPFTYPKVTVLNYGAHETSEIKQVLKEDKAILDGIVAFFSLTFFPKSEEMYNNLLNTINLLPPGGKFIGIVLSGENVNSLLNQSKSVYIKNYPDEKFIVKGYDSETTELERLGGEWEDAIESWVFDNVEREDVMKYIKTHKAYNCEAFTIKQQGPFFSQKDEDIEEENGISNSIIGDEIMIDLRGTGDDQTTMVQSQTEWLFNFNYFKKKLKDKMFTMVESYELTHPISLSKGGTLVYQNLPKDSQVFSSLNTAFVFKKRGLSKEEIKAAEKASEVLNRLKSNEVAPVKLKLKEIEFNLQRVGVIQSNTSFIHSVLLAVNKKYQDMDVDKREVQVGKVREILASKLTQEEFQELRGGTILASFEEKVRSDINQKRIKLKEKSIKEKAFEDFRENLRSLPDESGAGSWMRELEMTELLSQRYKVNIYVVSVTGTLGDVVFVKASTLFSNHCKSLYVHNKSVVLLLRKSVEYDLLKPLVGDGKTNTFDKSSEFVQQLYQEICG